jgi:hypothetical protein
MPAFTPAASTAMTCSKKPIRRLKGSSLGTSAIYLHGERRVGWEKEGCVDSVAIIYAWNVKDVHEQSLEEADD